MNPIAELSRRLDNLIRFGTIAEIDHDTARVRVQSGNLLTDWLPWAARRAGQTRDWDPPSEGEQVILLSPSGELTVAVALTALYSSANPAPSDDPSLTHRRYPDGAVVEYNHQTHALIVTLPAGATANITAPGGITLNGDVTINGALAIQGFSATHNGVNIGATHTHGGVTSGNSTTGIPQ